MPPRACHRGGWRPLLWGLGVHAILNNSHASIWHQRGSIGRLSKGLRCCTAMQLDHMPIMPTWVATSCMALHCDWCSIMVSVAVLAPSTLHAMRAAAEVGRAPGTHGFVCCVQGPSKR